MRHICGVPESQGAGAGPVLGGLRGRRRGAPAEARAGGALRGARMVVAALELRSGWGDTDRHWGAELPEATSPAVPRALGRGSGIWGSGRCRLCRERRDAGAQGRRGARPAADKLGSLAPCSQTPYDRCTPARSGAASPGEAAAGLAPPSGSFLAGFWGPGHPRTTLSHQAGRAVR